MVPRRLYTGVVGTTPVIIRTARTADAPVLAAMRWDFRSSIGEAVEARDAFIARCEPWMRDRLAAASNWRCWVAVQNGAIVGHLWLYLLEKIPNPVPEPESHAYITNVYVDPAHRQGGTGARLLDEALAFARDQGCDAAILWPTPGSRTLYARHGFAVRDDVMEAVLNEGRDFH